METDDDVAFTLHKSKELVSHYAILTANLQIVNAGLFDPRERRIVTDLQGVGNLLWG